MNQIFLGEFLGTMILIFLGNGVVANVTLKRTIGAKSGFLAITFGWGLAVFAGVIIANAFATGGHINPAVSLMALTKGDIDVAEFFVYISAQAVGALLGQLLVSAFYWNHFQESENGSAILGAHSTGPTHNKTISNLFSEFSATTVLVSVAMVLMLSYGGTTGGAMKDISNFVGPLSMALVVLSIGISLGGTTGYAINPFRDLMPRIIFQIMPYKYKGGANWGYSWIPVVAPLAAGAMVGLIGRFLL